MSRGFASSVRKTSALLALAACSPDDGEPPLVCPPPPPHGYVLGDTMADVPLARCDGTETSLHALCSAPAGLVFHFSGW